MPYHRKTTPQFVKEAQQVHGEKFDNSEVEYVNTHTPVKIKCRQCGVVFMQEPGGFYCKSKNRQGTSVAVKFFQELATQINWQKVDERTGAEIPDEEIFDVGTTPGGGGDTPGDDSDDLEE